MRSSHQIERLCATDVAFRVRCAQDIPDHSTIARFRVDCQDGFAALCTEVLLVAAHAGLARFGTVAIDGTKIAANASLDANRGQQWLERQVGEMIQDAERTDAVEDAAAARGGQGPADRVPGLGGDRTDRTRRIGEAAAQVAAQVGRRARADQERDKAALERRCRSEAGEPVRGRIPDGPHRLGEAQAHVAREVAGHQAKLDRRAAAVAEGRTLPGRPPVPTGAGSTVARARRVVEAAEQAAELVRATATKTSRAAAARLPKIVANTTDPQSRIMPTRKGVVQGDNTQVAVTADQVIVAVHL